MTRIPGESLDGRGDRPSLSHDGRWLATRQILARRWRSGVQDVRVDAPAAGWLSYEGMSVGGLSRDGRAVSYVSAVAPARERFDVFLRVGW